MKMSLFTQSLLILLISFFLLELNAQIVEIESTDQGFLPPRMTEIQRDAINGSQGMIIFNNTTQKLNYFDSTIPGWLEIYPDKHTSVIEYFRLLPNGIQTLLDAGETPINIINEGADTTEFIGLTYEGGIIFYLKNDGTGLVSAPTNQGITSWACRGILVGASGTIIGSGRPNTMNILNGCMVTNNAAEFCDNLDLNGFDDWFLPSKDELNEMYFKIGPGGIGVNQNIGNFAPSFYWSSSEDNDSNAWSQEFGSSAQVANNKNNDYQVRAVREF